MQPNRLKNGLDGWRHVMGSTLYTAGAHQAVPASLYFAASQLGAACKSLSSHSLTDQVPLNAMLPRGSAFYSIAWREFEVNLFADTGND